MNKQKLEKIILIMIIAAAMFYSYWTYLFQSEWSVLKNINQQIVTRTTYLNRLISYNDPAKFQQDLAKEQDLGKQLSSRLPSTLDKPQISVELYLLAKQQGVIPQSITFEPLQNKGNHQEMDITFVGQGSPANILSMLGVLEHGSTAKYALKSLNLTTGKDQTTANIKLTAFSGQLQGSKSEELPDLMKGSSGVDNPASLFVPATK